MNNFLKFIYNITNYFGWTKKDLRSLKEIMDELFEEHSDSVELKPIEEVIDSISTLMNRKYNNQDPIISVGLVTPKKRKIISDFQFLRKGLAKDTNGIEYNSIGFDNTFLLTEKNDAIGYFEAKSAENVKGSLHFLIILAGAEIADIKDLIKD